jgi:hypothetical protein
MAAKNGRQVLDVEFSPDIIESGQLGCQGRFDFFGSVCGGGVGRLPSTVCETLHTGPAVENQQVSGGRDRTRTCDLLRVKQAL